MYLVEENYSTHFYTSEVYEQIKDTLNKSAKVIKLYPESLFWAEKCEKEAAQFDLLGLSKQLALKNQQLQDQSQDHIQKCSHIVENNIKDHEENIKELLHANQQANEKLQELRRSVADKVDELDALTTKMNKLKEEKQKVVTLEIVQGGKSLCIKVFDTEATAEKFATKFAAARELLSDCGIDSNGIITTTQKTHHILTSDQDGNDFEYEYETESDVD